MLTKKGQVFSIDLLFATILIILFIGILINVIEIKNYEQKEALIKNELYSISQSSIINLTNGNYACEFNNIKLANSLNLNLVNSVDHEKISKDIGLIDKNFKIILNGLTIKENGNITSNNIASYNIDILTCNDTVEFLNIKECLNGNNCDVEKQKLTLMVSR